MGMHSSKVSQQTLRASYPLITISCFEADNALDLLIEQRERECSIIDGPPMADISIVISPCPAAQNSSMVQPLNSVQLELFSTRFSKSRLFNDVGFKRPLWY